MANTMKLFISTPMRGLDNETIKRSLVITANKAKEILSKRFPDTEFELVSSFFNRYDADNNDNESKHPEVVYLSRSIYLLSTCDLVVFAKGWEEARGCQIEHKIAENYEINRLELM